MVWDVQWPSENTLASLVSLLEPSFPPKTSAGEDFKSLKILYLPLFFHHTLPRPHSVVSPSLAVEALASGKRPGADSSVSTSYPSPSTRRVASPHLPVMAGTFRTSLPALGVLRAPEPCDLLLEHTSGSQHVLRQAGAIDEVPAGGHPAADCLLLKDAPQQRKGHGPLRGQLAARHGDHEGGCPSSPRRVHARYRHFATSRCAR